MSLPATETYTGAQAVMPNPPWTQQRTTGHTAQDGAGHGSPDVTTNAVYAFWNNDAFNNDQYAKKVITSGLSSGLRYAAVTVRASATGDASYNLYGFRTDGASGATHTEVFKVVAGTLTVLGNFATTFANGDEMKITVVGTTIECFQNGVSLGTVTDSSLASGSAGEGGQTDVLGSILWDTWEGGNMSSAAAAPRPRAVMPTIADRVARGMLFSAIAVHSVIGTHMLRGAPQRTKVALPVIRQTTITPPPSRSKLLPYRLQGAPQRKPRLLPTIALTRKPLPITRSVQLPHMLKGAPQRKPFLFPDVALIRRPLPSTKSIALPHVLKGTGLKPAPFPDVTSVRTPAPVTHSYTGKHAFPAPAAPRVIIDPTTQFARTPLPIARTVVVKSAAQGEERGPFPKPVVSLFRTRPPRTETVVGSQIPRTTLASSAGPTTHMLEALPPKTRSFVGFARIVPPAPPAPARPDPTVALIRTPFPRITSWGGPNGRWFLAAHQQWAEPVVALTRTPRIVTRQTVGIARPRLALPAVPRPRPRVSSVRITPPRIQSDAGSGVARGPASITLQLAIAVSTGSSAIASQASTASVALTTSQSSTIPLTTSE
jgi:hypothetical protein